ncbi:MAG: parallel beta-helix repeat protein [Halieaceae bacterium]|jgi:parallel beta-helix repeat protein
MTSQAAHSRATTRPHSVVLLLLLILLVSASGHARDYFASPESGRCTTTTCACVTPAAQCSLNRELLQRLKPGDTLSLQPGTYGSLRISDLHGSAEQPIIIAGTDVRINGEPASQVQGAHPASGDAIEIRESSHLILRHLSLKGARRAGIRINNSHNITITDSYFANNGVWGIFSNHSNDITITDNTLIGPAQQHGIYLSNSGDRGLIARNHIHGFDACGIQLNGDLSMGGGDEVPADGLISDVRIEHNLISGNGRVGGSAINLDGAIGTQIVGNLLLNNRAAGVAMFQIDGGAPSSGTRIESNLILGADEARSLIINGDGAQAQTIIDNILVARNPGRPVLEIKIENENSLLGFSLLPDSVPITLENNHYAMPRDFASINDRRLRSLDDWRANYPDEGSQLFEVDAFLRWESAEIRKERQAAQQHGEKGETAENGAQNQVSVPSERLHKVPAPALHLAKDRAPLRKNPYLHLLSAPDMP